MGYTLEEGMQAVFAIVDLGKRVAAAEAAVPDVLDAAGVKDVFETDLAKAKAFAPFVSEAADLIVKIRRDVKS
jgi:hypothetical protein